MSLFVIASHTAGVNVSHAALDPRDFKPKPSHRAINALWFLSLTLALLVSMLAILAKQWISMFVSRVRMPARDLRRWAHRHRAYREGIDKWHLSAFVSSLSVALHLALLFFLVGLNLYTFALDLAIFIPVAALSMMGLLLYAATTLLPLVDGTCPTATPLLVNSRRVILWAMEELGFTRDNTTAHFAEERVIIQDPVAADVDVVTWMIRNLPGEHEVEAAIDAIAGLPLCHPLDLIEVADHALAPSCNRLRKLTTGRHPIELEANAAEIARALRSVIRLEDGIEHEYGTLSTDLSWDLRHVRTHDLAVLSTALGIQVKSARRANPGLAAQHFSYELCGAIARWNRHVGGADPFSNHTRGIICSILHKSSHQVLGLVSIEDCACLVLIFCRDDNDSPRWVELTTRLLDGAIHNSQLSDRWRPLSDAASAECRGINAWAWIFSCISSTPTAQVFGQLQRSDVTECFMLLLQRCSRMVEAPVLTLSQLQGMLTPLTADIPDTPAAITGALRILRRTIESRDRSHREWDAGIAHVTFNIFDRAHYHQTAWDSTLSAEVLKILWCLLPRAESAHNAVLDRIVAHEITMEAVRHSILNILTLRPCRDGTRKSIWRLGVSLVSAPERLGTISSCVAGLCAQLCILSKADSSFSCVDLFEELLGDGLGTMFVLAADPHTTNVLDIAQHVASSAPVQWAAIRTELLAGESYWLETGHEWETPAGLVAAVEASDSCTACANAIEHAVGILAEQ